MRPPNRPPSPTTPERSTRPGVAFAATLLGSTGLPRPATPARRSSRTASASVSIRSLPGSKTRSGSSSSRTERSSRGRPRTATARRTSRSSCPRSSRSRAVSTAGVARAWVRRGARGRRPRGLGLVEDDADDLRIWRSAVVRRSSEPSASSGPRWESVRLGRVQRRSRERLTPGSRRRRRRRPTATSIARTSRRVRSRAGRAREMLGRSIPRRVGAATWRGRTVRRGERRRRAGDPGEYFGRSGSPSPTSSASTRFFASIQPLIIGDAGGVVGASVRRVHCMFPAYERRWGSSSGGCVAGVDHPIPDEGEAAFHRDRVPVDREVPHAAD